MRHFIIFLCIFFLGCSSNTSSNKRLNKIDEVTFDVGFMPSRINYFCNDNNEVFGFLDYQTFKTFKIFDVEGNLKYSFSTNELTAKSKQIFNSFSFQSTDTIAFLSKSGTNILTMVNNRGEIILEKDYSQLLKKEVSLYAPFIVKDNILRAAINYNDTISNPQIDETYYRNFFSRKIHFPNLFIDSFIESIGIDYNFQIDSFYSRFTTNEVWSTEYNKILYLEDKNIIYSVYSDSLYEYNLNGELLNIIPIYSKLPVTYVSPIPLNSGKDLVEEIKETPCITHLLWDNYRSLYYCFIAEAINENNITPFNIIILNKEFEFIDEIKMNSDKLDFNKFEYYPAFVGKKGLYIRNRNENIKETSFSIFRYE